MTEDIAKTKWCPQVRISASNIMSGSTGIERDNNANCIGSACMFGSAINGKWLGYCGLSVTGNK